MHTFVTSRSTDHHPRAIIWLGIWSLVLSLMMPLISIQAADAAAGIALQECDEGLVLDEQSGECVPANEDNNQQDGQGADDQGDGEQPQCGPGTTFDPNSNQCVPDQPDTQPSSGVQINKYSCPPGSDWYQVSYQELVNGCVENQQPVSFTYTDPDGQSSTDGVTSGFEWSPTGAGSQAISEQIPAGYGEPIFYCGSYVPNQANPLLNPAQVENGNTVTWNLGDGEWLYCQVFNVQLGDGNSVTVYKWLCQPGTETGQDMGYYQGEDQDVGPCEQEHLNIPIALTDAGGEHATTTQANGTEWNNVMPDQAGSFQVAVDEPDGFGDPMVFCGTLDDETFSPVSATGGMITITPTSQPFTYQCNWYDIPEGDQILVIKQWCPPGLAFVQEPTYDDLDQACNEEGSATFELDGPEGAPQDWPPQNPQGDPPMAGWIGVPPGDYVITETGLDDSWTAQVFCLNLPTGPVDGQRNGDTSTSLARTLPPNPVELNENGGLDVTVAEGSSWYCAWFNIPGTTEPENENSVTVYKWECEPGTESGQDQGYYQGDDQDVGPCESEHLNIPISLIDANGDHPTTTQANGTEWDNVLLDNGSFQIAIDEPDGFGDPMVFCGTLDEDTQTMVPAPGGVWTLTPASEPFTYQCNAYDIPADGGVVIMETGNSVTVYKWECEPGTEPGQDQGYYQGVGPCEQEHLNIPISLIDATGDHPTTTQANGTQWDDVALNNGSFQIAIDEPDGFGDPMVFCGTLDEDAQTMVPAPGGMWTLTPTSEPFTYQCNVYDIAGDDYNFIDFYKFVCSFDPITEADINAAQDYYEQNCQPAGEGWEFELDFDTGGGPGTRTTDANGHVGWAIPAANWSTSETLPEGYPNPVVFCRYLEWPDDYPAQLNSDWSRWDNNGFGYGFPDVGVHFECRWYNFPPEGEGDNWVDFYKLWCPAGTPYDASFPDLREACEYRDEPVELTLSYGNTTSPATAQDQTPATWQSVPTGAWTVYEAPSEGYGSPIIWCQYLEWPDSAEGVSDDPFQVEWGDEGATWELPYSNVQLACAIFNIPAEGSWLDITKWWCSENITNPYDQSVDNLLEECERYTDGVDFTLQYGDQEQPATTDGDGNAEWSDIPTGQWNVQETIPDGYGEPVVYCRWVEWPDGILVVVDPFEVPVSDGLFSSEFKYGSMRLHCDVFNIRTYDPGHITVYKWYCPEGVPPDSTPEYLRENCDIVTTGVDFSLVYGDATVPLTTGADGKATWDDVPQGQWELKESPDEGYARPVIYCQYVEGPENSNLSKELFTPETQGYSVHGTFDYPGVHLVCYWFNFEPEHDDNWITIFKYFCPPGGTYPDDLDAYLEGCSDSPMDGASFTLTSDQYPAGSPKVSAAGQVRWEGLQQGEFQIQEALADGQAPPKIWCARYQPSDTSMDSVPALDAFEPVTVENGGWRGTIDESPLRIVCYVFNLPDDDNTVTVYKYLCDHKPVGYNSLGEWLDACPTKGNDIEFTLDNSEGPQPLNTSNGEATWDSVPVGPFTLTETPQPGYGKPVVWCGWTAYYNGAVYDAFPQQVDATGGVFHGEVTVPGTKYFCFWFNIPEDNSHITIYKFFCLEGKLEGVVPNPFEWYKEHCTEPGNGIRFTLENSLGTSTKPISGGSATWNNVPQGEFTLSEQVPSGYDEPLWWCQGRYYKPDGSMTIQLMSLQGTPGDSYGDKIDHERTEYTCWVFNFPDRDHTVTVHKWYCPVGTEPDSKSFDQWTSICTTPMSGVRFTHEDGDGSIWKLTDGSGTATWYGAERGDNSLTEDHLPGFEPPIIYCELDARYDDGAAYAEGPTPYTVTDNSVSKSLDYATFHWTCHVFNIPKGPGEITIYKWLCPPGYDLDAWDADPKMDCTQAMNGIPFTLDQPVGPNQMSNTGDSMPGAVYFGSLDPGHYIVSETVPSDTDYVFIWDCVGGDNAKVQPHPVTWGNVLDVNVAGGDSIVCNWYNVPDPERGWITLYKYSCSTETYQSEVDCEIYEFGASFELFQVDGNVSKGVQDTNAGGQITWADLDEGAYSLDEISHTPCKITSTRVDGEGNAWVDAGQGTVIKVYNCKVDTSTVPGKVPGKYPNTGVGPAGDAALPSMQQTPEPDETPIQPVEGTPTDPVEAAEAFYQVNCLNDTTGGAGTPTAFDPDELDDDSGLPPFLQTQEAEPTAEAESSPTSEQAPCVRGALPEQLVIDVANVNHPVEVVEIVDGVMQAPSGPNVVSWYKETARLGEIGNTVIAGHLNWWNVPEGPFFAIDTLQEGDRIEITGDDGKRYVFEVQWVKLESNEEPPAADVVGPTDDISLTLITCGGEWDSAVSEYDGRTVVRAVQVDVLDPPDVASEGATMIGDLAA